MLSMNNECILSISLSGSMSNVMLFGRPLKTNKKKHSFNDSGLGLGLGIGMIVSIIYCNVLACHCLLLFEVKHKLVALIF